jgi:hypothetical protein
MGITRWLEGRGRERYRHALRESDMDATVLPGLTGADLTATGVTLIGHWKLFAAIVALRPDTQSAPV